MKRQNLKITYGVLFIGLKKDWLTPRETVDYINDFSEQLACEEDFLIAVNVHQDDKALIQALLEKENLDEEKALKYWQESVLLTIKQSNKSIEEKLREIEKQWSRFDYPEEWRDFIYYMPSEKSSSSEGVYQTFLNYINHL